MADFYRSPPNRPGGRSRSWPGSDFLSSDLPAQSDPTADWQLAISPSYKNTSRTLTLNTTSVAASEVLYADAATATTWSPFSGSGTMTATAGEVALYGPFVDEVAGLENDRYVESGSTFGDIASEDFAIEITCRAPFDGTNTSMIGKVSGGVGWQLYFNAGVPTFSIDDNVTEVTDDDASSTVAAGEWCHIMVICDRSSTTGLRIYVNGTQSASPGNCSAVGSITNPGSMTIGDTSRDFAVGHIAIWKQTSWLNGSDYASVVTQRFEQIQGWYNAQSTATITPGNQPCTTYATDSTDGETRVVRLGDNWIPCRIDSDGGHSWAQPAVRQATLTDPEDLSDALWTKNDCTISTDQADSPYGPGSGGADGIVVNTTQTGSAFIYDNIPNLSNYGVTLQFWAKKGSSDYLWCACETGALYVSEHCIINLTNGTVEKQPPKAAGGNSQLTWRTEDWGNGWYRCLGYGLPGSTPLFGIGPCDSASDYSVIDGDASTINTYLWGVNAIRGPAAQLQSDPDPPYVPTTDATKTADTLTFDITSADPLGDGIGSVWFNYKRFGTNVTVADTPLLIDDASDATDKIEFTQEANNLVTCTIADGTGTDGVVVTTTNMVGGTQREIRVAHETDTNVSIQVDSTEEATDTYTASPADLDVVELKRGVSDLRLFKTKQT